MRGGASGSLGHGSRGTTEHEALEADQVQSNVLVLRLESQPGRLITSSSSLMALQQLCGGRQLGLAPEASPGGLPSGSGQPLPGGVSLAETLYQVEPWSKRPRYMLCP